MRTGWEGLRPIPVENSRPEKFAQRRRDRRDDGLRGGAGAEGWKCACRSFAQMWGVGWRAACHRLPFVSSEVETPIGRTLGLRGISTSLDANGLGGLTAYTGRKQSSREIRAEAQRSQRRLFTRRRGAAERLVRAGRPVFRSGDAAYCNVSERKPLGGGRVSPRLRVSLYSGLS